MNNAESPSEVEQPTNHLPDDVVAEDLTARAIDFIFDELANPAATVQVAVYRVEQDQGQGGAGALLISRQARHRQTLSSNPQISCTCWKVPL